VKLVFASATKVRFLVRTAINSTTKYEIRTDYLILRSSAGKSLFEMSTHEVRKRFPVV